ncbi:uncharacterized protein C1orf87 homolog [Pseudophryne corroboree]|uniref:uncharacterized protein C1orf87 homolog n=1 Tax=Pseudophryne corroboree TaxID=495146 RepID=UPI0030818630
MSHIRSPRPVSDAMPEMVVKIIGSKYVRYPVDQAKQCPVRNNDVGSSESAIRVIFSGIHDVDSFRQDLLRMDRSSCGLLSVSEFHSVCERHGASAPFSVLIRLLKDDAFTERGKIRWKKIVELLHGADNQNKPSQQEDAGKEDPPSPRTEADSTAQPGHTDVSGRQTSEGPYLAGNNCSSQWDSRPATEPALHSFERRSSEDQEAWIDRFKRLENVLQLCQIKDTGLVETARAKDVIHKFNVIYNLNLSAEKITEALEKFSSGDCFLLRPALLFLKEL